MPERVPGIPIVEIAFSKFVAEDGAERLRVPAWVGQYAFGKAPESEHFEMFCF